MGWLKKLGKVAARGLAGAALGPGAGAVIDVAHHSDKSVSGLLGDAAGAVGDFAGDPFGREFSASEAQKARQHAEYMQGKSHEFSSAEALLAREHATNEAEMARTFSSSEAKAARMHQRQMALDLPGLQMEGYKKAGLNPILAAQFGGSAPPPGPAATSHAPSSPQAHGVSGGGQGANSPVSAVRDALGLFAIKADIKRTLSEANRNNAEAGDIAATQPHRIDSIKSATEQAKAIVKNTDADTAVKKKVENEVQERINKLVQEVRSAKSQAERDAVMEKWDKEWGKQVELWSDAIGLKGRDITQMMSIVGSLFKLFGKKSGNYSPDPERPFGF